MSAGDGWLAAYTRSEGQAWCSNRSCPNHTDPVPVLFETEWGQGWQSPETCPDCGASWLYDEPQQEEDDDVSEN